MKLGTDIKLDKLGIKAGDYDEKAGLKYYEDNISKSIIMNVQAEFDNIVHAIVTKVNEVLAEKMPSSWNAFTSFSPILKSTELSSLVNPSIAGVIY